MSLPVMSDLFAPSHVSGRRDHVADSSAAFDSVTPARPGEGDAREFVGNVRVVQLARARRQVL